MSSKGYFATWAGSALLATGMLAGCDTGQDPGAPDAQDPTGDNLAMYEPDDTAGDQTGTTADDPATATDPGMGGDDPMLGSDRTQQSGQQSGMGAGGSVADMSSEQVLDKTIVSQNGEEIGSIDDVVVDPTSGQKFAVVDVGGFLGVGEKSIVIALDELQKGSGPDDDRLQSNLTREELQTKTEYSPGDYESTTGSGQTGQDQSQ